MVAEPATPRYLNWLEYPIQFSREDQWTSVGNAGHYPLVLDPTIASMTVTKVLIDGGAGLNIIFSETLRKMGLQLTGMITPTSTPFYRIKGTRPEQDIFHHSIWCLLLQNHVILTQECWCNLPKSYPNVPW